MLRYLQIKSNKEQKIKQKPKDNMASFKIDQDPCPQRNNFKHPPSPPKRRNFEEMNNLFFIQREK